MSKVEPYVSSVARSRVSSVIALLADWIRRSSLKSTSSFILRAKLTNTASECNQKLSFVSSSLLRYAFDTFDTNNDGAITFDEFLLAVAASSQGDVNDRLEVAFDL
jgi:Ca2+-binding EF-hand superfamily protein